MEFKSSQRVLKNISFEVLQTEIEKKLSKTLKKINGVSKEVYEINLRVPVKYKGSVTFYEIKTYIEICVINKKVNLITYSDLNNAIGYSCFFSFIIAIFFIGLFNLETALISTLFAFPILLFFRTLRIKQRSKELVNELIQF